MYSVRNILPTPYLCQSILAQSYAIKVWQQKFVSNEQVL